VHDLRDRSVSDAVQDNVERENTASNLPSGINGIERPLTLFIRSKWAIDFAAPDGKPVNCFLFILVPSGGDPEEHLQLLGLVAQMFSNPAFRGRIAHTDNFAAVRTVFAEWAGRLAGSAA